MDATIAICTWNRADLLDQTLTQLGRLQAPAGLTWEVLVVNNRSTDHTDDVLAGHASRLPLRRIFEEKQGQSHARNAAAQAARGQVILWTDDDVLVDPEWLSEMLLAADRHPDVSFFGGPIEPWFSQPAPAWLTRNWSLVANAYATRDFGPQPFALTPDKLPFGANFMVRTAAQRRYLYDPALGRVAAGEVRGEEMQLLTTMLAAGERGLWVPGARVKHFIPPDRINLDYLLRFYHGIGQTLCRRDVIRGKRPEELRIARKRRQALFNRLLAGLSGAVPLQGRSLSLARRLRAARDQGYYEAGLALQQEAAAAKAA